MNSFLRWFTVNGIIMALFIVGVLTHSSSIYFAFTAIGIFSFLSLVSIFMPSFILHAITSTPFTGKRFADFLYDTTFIVGLVYFGFYIWAIVYVPILIAAQLNTEEAV